MTVEPGTPTDLHDSGAYRAGTPRLYRAALPALRVFDRRRLTLLRRIATPPAKVLDAGAGQGRFVAAARAAGYEAFGIEPAQRGLERARQLGVPVAPVTIEAAEIEAGSLDAVVLWHVLEHLADPAGAIERIAGWLRPGGGVLVGVPNVGSLQSRVGGDRWYHLACRATGPISPREGWRACWSAADWPRLPCITCCSSTTPSGCGSRRSTG